MAELQFWPGEQDLERALADLGRELAYPPTPQLAVVVRQRLAEESARPSRRWRWLPVPDRGVRRWLPRLDRRLAVGLAAVLVLVAVVLAISPEARDAVAGRLGLRGVRIEEVPAVTTPRATQLNLGERLTLDQLRLQVAYPVELPAALGAPDEVYLSNTPVGGQAALVYYPRPDLQQANTTGVGLLLTEFRGSVRSTAALGKGIPPGTHLEEVQVNGGPGFWIDGDPHTFFYVDARGQIQPESTRLAANVLLWEQGELTLRLESALPRDPTLAIAATVR
ncbi:MAG TPA: hypothetical protein VK898_11780 [Chloroflexota bacterium]|nr:hypothetical protein [Chloroflexota bacterium]